MKSIRHITGFCALALGLSISTRVIAADDHKKHHEKTEAAATAGAGELVKLAEKNSAWATKARAAYPLKVCVTSDEKLGSMGDNAEYIYREKGKPDRLVVFCCEGCEDDFKKEPAKYLAKLDAAAKQKPAAK
jgi:hypothetical protein